MTRMNANQEMAYRLYQEGGQERVLTAVYDGIVRRDFWGRCKGCESNCPFEDGACLVCGMQFHELDRTPEMRHLLETAQGLLSDVYHWACENDVAAISDLLSCADSCVLDSLSVLHDMRKE